MVNSQNLRHSFVWFTGSRNVSVKRKRTRVPDSATMYAMKSLCYDNTRDTIDVSMRGLDKTQFPMKRGEAFGNKNNWAYFYFWVTFNVSTATDSNGTRRAFKFAWLRHPVNRSKDIGDTSLLSSAVPRAEQAETSP